MHCNEARRLISSALDVQLDESASEALRLHVTDCTECRLFQADLEEAGALLSRIPAPDLSIDVTDAVLSRLTPQEAKRLKNKIKELYPEASFEA